MFLKNVFLNVFLKMSQFFDDVGDNLISVLFQKNGETTKNDTSSNTRFGNKTTDKDEIIDSLEICDDMIKRRKEELSKVKNIQIENITKQVLKKWMMKVQMSNYRNHDCLSLRCRHSPMIIEHRETHTCATALGKKACIGIRSQTAWAVCPKGTPNWVEKDIYVCTTSGIPHWCGRKCKLLGDNHSGDKSCPLTGRMVCNKKMVGGFWKRDGANTGITDTETQKGAKLFKRRTKRGGFQRMRLDSEDIRLMKGQFTCSTFEEWIHQLTLVERYTQIHNHMMVGIESIAPGDGLIHYKIIACSKIWYMFCEERYYEDEKRMENTQHVAETKVKDELKRLEKKNGPISWADLSTIYAREISVRRAAPIRLYDKNNRSKEQTENVVSLIIEYAHAVLRVWCVIRLRTDMGQKHPQKFPFDEFVLPCMYKLWVGIEVQSPTPGEHICILARDERLGLYLPEEHSITKIIGVRSEFSKIQLNIIDAFNEAILEHNMNEDSLRLDRIDFGQCQYLFNCIFKSKHVKKRRVDCG